MKAIFALALMTIISLPQVSQAAQYGPCTKWEEARSRTCTFNSRSTQLWVRACTHIWDLQAICMDEDPNQLEGPCSKWVAERGTTCSNGYRFEQSWVRSCQTAHYKMKICTDQNPNNL